MKNITFFICTLGSGGAEHQLVVLSDMLLACSYDITITTFGQTKDHYNIDSRIKRVCLGEKKGKIAQMFSIFYYFLRLKTDVVISFGQRESVYCLIPLLFRRKIKVISGERNFTVGKSSIYEKLLTKFLYKRSRYVVSNNYSQSKHLVKLNPQLKDKVRVIVNHTNLSLFNYKGYCPNNPIRIGVFARYSEQKNYVRFVKAIALLRKKTNIKFVVEWYGNKIFKDKQTNEHYVKMKAMIDNLGLEECLRLNNHVTDVASVLNKFDVIALPSLFEGFSNSISEAICSGRPVVCSDVSDNSVMVHNGENGFLFNPLDAEDMSIVLLRMLELSNEDRYKMSLASRKIAESLFDEHIFLHSYQQFIES